TAKNTSPFVATLTEEAVKNIKAWLPKALDNPQDLEARYWLLYASMLAGIDIDASATHIIHAIEHAISGLKPEIPHGAGLAILGPRSIYHTHKAVPQESARVLRQIDPTIKPVAKDAEKAEKTVKEWQKNLGFEKP
ncbi:MAG: iron-containing alcohol dehydrogenase, partial [Staphylothermus sp.]|nr:iron-containing alcohol dehydrogenase [Staphylothermus sp.]